MVGKACADSDACLMTFKSMFAGSEPDGGPGLGVGDVGAKAEAGDVPLGEGEWGMPGQAVAETMEKAAAKVQELEELARRAQEVAAEGAKAAASSLEWYGTKGAAAAAEVAQRMPTAQDAAREVLAAVDQVARRMCILVSEQSLAAAPGVLPQLPQTHCE